MVNGFANESGRKKVWFDAIPFYLPKNPCFYGNFPMDIVDVSLLPMKVYGKIIKRIGSDHVIAKKIAANRFNDNSINPAFFIPFICSCPFL